MSAPSGRRASRPFQWAPAPGIGGYRNALDPSIVAFILEDVF